MNELINQISEKRKELNNLETQYDQEMEDEKKKVLTAKTTGFKKTLYLLAQDFESSSGRTPQYLEFHKVFKKEFTAMLKSFTTELELSKPNHFDVTGFFKMDDGRIYYFSVGDLRWAKDSMLIRTADGFKDYTGGSNGFINLNDAFEQNLLNYLGVKRTQETLLARN